MRTHLIYLAVILLMTLGKYVSDVKSEVRKQLLLSVEVNNREECIEVVELPGRTPGCIKVEKREEEIGKEVLFYSSK